MARVKKAQNKSSGANLGFEATLWAAADKLRGHLDAADYKRVVLGLILLKYISDAFEELRARLITEQAEGANREDPDEYRAENVFWVPPEARWSHFRANKTITGFKTDRGLARNLGERGCDLLEEYFGEEE